MALFHEADRKSLLDDIVSFTARNAHIMALIAVGSGAYGYHDALSDLDFVVAIDSPEHLDDVRAYVADELRKRVSLIYFKQDLHIPLQVYLCADFLEIDMGYGVYTRAAATRAHWKVLFDKTGTVHDAMQRSWEKAQRQPPTDEYARKCAECADRVWHNLMHCAVAIKRQQCWRAAAELDIARNMLIQLLGLRYGLDTERGRDVDQLPESVLMTLQKTLASDFAPEALWLSLACLTDAIYTELERNETHACMQVSRQHVEEYIHACRI